MAIIQHHPPERHKVGTWRDMDYDAVAIVHGLVWRRAQGGFGDKNSRREREDWVLDLPQASAHVVRERRLYGHNAGPWSKWGISTFHLDYEKIEDAMYAALQGELGYIQFKLEETAEKLGGYAVTAHDMKVALEAQRG